MNNSDTWLEVPKYLGKDAFNDSASKALSLKTYKFIDKNSVSVNLIDVKEDKKHAKVIRGSLCSCIKASELDLFCIIIDDKATCMNFTYDDKVLAAQLTSRLPVSAHCNLIPLPEVPIENAWQQIHTAKWTGCLSRGLLGRYETKNTCAILIVEC